MARYLYRCENKDCLHEQEFEIPMSEAKDPKPCPQCWKGMHRVFEPAADHWRDSRGRYQRAPGKAWVGPDEFDETTFHKLNDVNSNRHKYTRKKAS